MRRGIELALASTSVAFLLAGCMPVGDVATPGRSVQPQTSNTAEAVAEKAESTWNAYFAASAAILNGRETDVASVKPYLTAAEYKVIRVGLENFVADGHRIDGETASRSFQVVGGDLDDGKLSALVCFVNGDSRILNRDSEDVTPNSRRAEFTLKLGFIEQSGRVLLDSDETWEKASAC